VTGCLVKDEGRTVPRRRDVTEMGSRRWDKKPETEVDTKFFDLRESGYKGPINEKGNKVDTPAKYRQWLKGGPDRDVSE
jgi:hypothetical protein